MKRRIMAVVLSIAILFSDSASVFACDRKQTETYVSQMLFGDKAEKYKSNEKVQMLMMHFTFAQNNMTTMIQKN